MTNEQIKKKIEADKKVQQLRDSGLSKEFRSLGSDFSDVSYTKGFGQLYDQTLSGDYEMKFENYLGLEGNEDRLAKQQSSWEQVYNGLSKNLMKTGLYAADAINTATYGLYSAVTKGSLQALWDNDVSNYLDDQAKRLDRNFANYYTDEEKSKGFFGRMFTNPANFLANDVAGGLAFIGGAVLPEVAIGILTGGASLAGSGAKLAARVGLKSAFREGAEQIAKQATRKQFKDGFSALLRSKVGANAGEVLNTAKFVAQSTFFEAGMEARHNFHDSIDTFVQDFEAREGRLPSQDELSTFIGDASSAANGVFAANVALLSITNAAMFGKTFNLPSMDLDTKIGKMFGLNVTKLPNGKMAMTEATKLQKVGGNAYFLAKKPVMEGVVEEGLQGVFGKTMGNYLDAKYDPNQSDVSVLGAFGDALKEQYTTKEGWFEIGIGAIIGMVGGNVSGDFGVEGLGRKGYSGARKGLEGKVENYNNTTEKALKNLFRANSVMNYNASQEAGIASTPAFQDTIVNYNYIKANESLKGYTNTIEDYNTVVDNYEMNPQEMERLGFTTQEQVTNYKESLKENFANDYSIYQEVNTIVESLEVPNYSVGELGEFRDAVTFSLMAGKKAGVESANIAKILSEITGVDGLYDAMKFSQELDANFDNNVQTLKEKESRLEELKKEILTIGEKLQESKGNENLYKENSKKYVVATQEIRKLEEETKNLEQQLEKDFQAMQAEITFTPQQMQTLGIKDILGKMDSVKEYVDSLKKMGRTKEAKNIETLLDQFNAYSSAEIDAISTMRRMSETDFYSSKEGKGLLGKIRGEKYKMSDEAKKEIEASEADVRDILIKNGFEYSNAVETIEKILSANPNLSEREKFKTESMLRTILAHKRINEKVEEVQKELETAVEEETLDEGDTIFISKNLQGRDLTNPETINQLIKDITSEIDVIVNNPTAESLREIKAKEKEIEQLKQQIIDLQNANQKQSTESIPMGNESQISGEVREGNTQGQEVTQESNQEEITILESLQRDLEFELTSEFGSPEMAEKIKEQIDSLTEEEIDEVINEIEQEDDTTRENGTNIGGENVTNTDGTSREDVAEETVETTQTVNATSDVENQIQEITQSIQRLEDEIKDLKTPFKFMESEGYKRYNQLVAKEELTEEEQAELENLESSINQWITITGVRAQGIELSDLIKQLQALESTIVNTPIETIEVTEEEVDEDIKQSEDAVQNNYDVGLSYNAVVSRRTKDSVIISNITLEGLEEATGVQLKDRDGIETTETGGIKLPNYLVDEINQNGKVVIINPAYDESTTYYALVLSSIQDLATGVETFAPLSSDFDTEYEDAQMNPEVIYQAERGEEVLFKIDPREPFTAELLNQLRDEMGVSKPLTDEEFKAEVEKIVQAHAQKSKIIESTQAELARIQSKEERLSTDKYTILKLEKRLKDQLAEIRKKAEEDVLNRKEKKPKKPSEALMTKILNKLRITIIDEQGRNQQILKGIRESDGYEGTNPHFEAIRVQLTSNPEILLDLIESTNYDTYNLGVKVLKVYAGHPNYIYSRNAEGKLVRQNKPIIQEDLNKIEDIGYIENGKLVLRSGNDDNVNVDFVKSSLKKKGKTKTPIVIIKKGSQRIAYPVRVGRDESPINLDTFQSIYESDSITAVDKAIRLNTMLSQAGIDIKTKGNAFVVVGDNALNEEFFNNIFAKLKEKEYIRSVESWSDPKQSISDALLNNATINIKLSDPFISPKIKYDFSMIKVEEMPQTKKKSTKKAVVDGKESVLKQFRCK